MIKIEQFSNHGNRITIKRTKYVIRVDSFLVDEEGSF